jgi:ABC-type uncharacterized transport system ATPase subunit
MIQRILLAREFAETEVSPGTLISEGVSGEAPLLVLAEAGSGLDQVNRARLEEELRAHVRHGAAALLFSTDVDELLSVADEIMVLRNGNLAAYLGKDNEF